MALRSNSESDQVEQDVRMIVGGNFTPDALGPETYAATRARAESDPERYLQVAQRLFMGPAFDARQHADLHLPLLLKLTSVSAPELTREVAVRLVREYEDSLERLPGGDPLEAPDRFTPSEDEEVNRGRRLRARIVDIEREVLERLSR